MKGLIPMKKILICKRSCNDESIFMEYYFEEGNDENYVYLLCSDDSRTAYRWVFPSEYTYGYFVTLSERRITLYEELDKIAERETIVTDDIFSRYPDNNYFYISEGNFIIKVFAKDWETKYKNMSFDEMYEHIDALRFRDFYRGKNK